MCRFFLSLEFLYLTKLEGLSAYVRIKVKENQYYRQSLLADLVLENSSSTIKVAYILNFALSSTRFAFKSIQNST